MTLRPYKFQIVPVVQEIDADGNVVGEQTLASTAGGQPVTVFGLDGLRAFADTFQARLEQAEE